MSCTHALFIHLFCILGRNGMFEVVVGNNKNMFSRHAHNTMYMLWFENFLV